ncbi:MAG: DUF1800 domain-containing protein [Acidobacteria bacterium]|nr:DUF1800 domain-containing protein [Acidobacteriota bacterium]
MLSLFVVLSLLMGNLMWVSAKATKATSKGLTTDQKIIQLLNRTGFGARPGDVERVKKMGIEKYLELQLHPERLNDAALEARLKNFESLNMTLAQINEHYPPPQLLARELGIKPGKKPQADANKNSPNESQNVAGDETQRREYRQLLAQYYREHDAKPISLLLFELQGQKIVRAAYSERQLQEVMTDFWFNHFNVFWAKNGVKSTATDYEMNAIRPNTFGKFKDLLLATAKSSAMMQYLDNFQSSSPTASFAARRGNGNGGRFQGRGFGQAGRNRQLTEEQQKRLEAFQQQNAKRKPGINENYARELMELHTMGVDGGYTQKDVQEVARCFTGWTIERPIPGVGGKKGAGEFIFRAAMHDDGEKVVLGQKIPAGGGIHDGERVIEILAKNPATVKFISTKLVRRFVNDNPPQALVDKVSSVYLKTDGDIREMLKTIFTAAEFYAPENYRAKIKSPFELAVSALRAMNGDTANPRQVAQFIAKMGQPLYLYQPPTGYPDRADQWVNTGALLERLNFGLALSSNKILGATIDPKIFVGNVDAKNQQQLLDKAIAMLLNGEVSTQTRGVLETQLKEGVAVKGELGDVSKIPNAAGTTMAESHEAMIADDEAMRNRQGKAAKGDAISKAERGGMRYERMMGIQARTQAPVDPEVAKVFGLVLGSPEFQRK